ncbi:hypothetical protein [Ornithobacterium rhinotracheale]|uniref:hypothetical protein n=1 Tax=Ornithobacterium rhinotracheale TaxID=28251 RepID=UPI00215922B3|nr:hypothetical protein [Ornithobacterium rhinotracheale]UVD87855.1 hypothetical protein NV236_03095 [Ornithobacterium rhinotracheale]
MQVSRNILALGLAFLIVVANAIFGYYFAPDEITITPLVVSLTALLVCFGTKNLRLIYIAIWTYIFLGLNDILIKLFGGGMHDSLGQTLINSASWIGLVPVLIILITKLIKTKNIETTTERVKAFILFVILVIIHFVLFLNLGQGRCCNC